MTDVVVGIRVALAVTFAWAFLSKARDFRGFRHGLVGFGVPPRFAAVTGAGLVSSEFLAVVAALLAPTWLAAGVATFLLGLFGLAQLRVLVRGVVTECHCFGSTEQVGAGSLARVIWFLVLSLVAALGSAELTTQPASPLSLVVACLALTVAIWAAVIDELPKAIWRSLVAAVRRERNLQWMS